VCGLLGGRFRGAIADPDDAGNHHPGVHAAQPQLAALARADQAQGLDPEALEELLAAGVRGLADPQHGLAHREQGARRQVADAEGRTSRAVAHHTVDELWYILHGHGQMWRRQAGQQETVPLDAGTCLSIPAGTHFQFRADGDGPLAAVGVTMPPWPGEDEAYQVPGAWPADP
jgi:mannose-6-phosphate isomerase-like protein (cupin superfamily)